LGRWRFISLKKLAGKVMRLPILSHISPEDAERRELDWVYRGREKRGKDTRCDLNDPT